MLVTNDFNDYEIIDASNGMKYERWGNFYLLRPDPQVISKFQFWILALLGIRARPALISSVVRVALINIK